MLRYLLPYAALQQGPCGACWAYSASNVLSYHYKARVSVPALMACCSGSCSGGLPHEALALDPSGAARACASDPKRVRWGRAKGPEVLHRLLQYHGPLVVSFDIGGAGRRPKHSVVLFGSRAPWHFELFDSVRGRRVVPWGASRRFGLLDYVAHLAQHVRTT